MQGFTVRWVECGYLGCSTACGVQGFQIRVNCQQRWFSSKMSGTEYLARFGTEHRYLSQSRLRGVEKASIQAKQNSMWITRNSNGFRYFCLSYINDTDT